MPQCDSIGRPASRGAQAILVSPTVLTQCTPCLVVSLFISPFRDEFLVPESLVLRCALLPAKGWGSLDRKYGGGGRAYDILI